MDIARYREALPRIFDLALGITTIENLMIKDKITTIEHDIVKLEKERNVLEKEIENHDESLQILIKKAMEAKIISSTSIYLDKAVRELEGILITGELPIVEIKENKDIEKLKQKKQKIEIQLVKLRRFKNRYATYKKHLSKEEDALKPIRYINKTFSENISNDEYRQFLNILEYELGNIKKAIKEKLPFEYGVDDKIDELEKELNVIKKKLEIVPDIDDTIKSDKERLISIGEIKNELLHLINQKISPEKIDKKIEIKENELSSLKDIYNSPEKSKTIIINALNDYVQTYIEVAQSALDEYGKYLATFDYSKKVLKLRRSKATTTANITSSSDHLFMHLCLFLGMHELIINRNVPYILPFLIIDQPSRPYFNNSTFDYSNSKENLSKKDDWNKVKEIFHLIDAFLENILKDKHHFQVILLEHVSDDAWHECKHIHLVEIFDGISNALIPPIGKRKNHK